jgi:hypothetical protein
MIDNGPLPSDLLFSCVFSIADIFQEQGDGRQDKKVMENS